MFKIICFDSVLPQLLLWTWLINLLEFEKKTLTVLLNLFTFCDLNGYFTFFTSLISLLN
jgi:hypothetical protein